VLVTQGTVANHNFSLLVAPTLAAKANEPDVLLVATAGGRPIEAIPSKIPSNARVASFLPFEWLLPRVSVLVTNGGYGSVNHGMSFGVPLVTAGLTEDKADVNARIAWSAVGINLANHAMLRRCSGGGSITAQCADLSLQQVSTAQSDTDFSDDPISSRHILFYDGLVIDLYRSIRAVYLMGYRWRNEG
jgi:hypothetical protein